MDIEVDQNQTNQSLLLNRDCKTNTSVVPDKRCGLSKEALELLMKSMCRILDNQPEVICTNVSSPSVSLITSESLEVALDLCAETSNPEFRKCIDLIDNYQKANAAVFSKSQRLMSV